jgi:hypothetical protein
MSNKILTKPKIIIHTNFKDELKIHFGKKQILFLKDDWEFLKKLLQVIQIIFKNLGAEVSIIIFE